MDSFRDEIGKERAHIEERMQLVIDLSRLNIEQGTGGPFAAAIFDLETNRLVSPGLNLVLSSNCSVAHAEITAIIIAQQKLGSYDLSDSGAGRYELVSSTEPCAMCLGAVCWAGLRQLVCGARDEDARVIGFDEGPKSNDWQDQLAKRDIRVIRDVARGAAVKILKRYADQGGLIYNPRRG